MNIYIDFTHSVPDGDTKFHGGMNYTQKLLELIIQESFIEKTFYILWPKGYHPTGEVEKVIRDTDVFKIIEVTRVDENFHFENPAVLYFPLLKVRAWEIAKQIKNKFPEIKIYITVHGLRLLDLKMDKYHGFYNGGLGYSVLGLESVKDLAGKIIYKKLIKKNILYFDKVFTVSNYSLQQIIKAGNPKYINYYYQGITIVDDPLKHRFTEEFILFVSGNRPVKNLIRALEAFCKFKIKTDNQIFMFVTGINKQSKDNILRYFKPSDKKLIASWVKFYDYVEIDLLSDLYRQCKFLLFTSLSEGFGLPVIEAMFYGRPVVASNVTSIPEVGGSAVYYVNPYDVESIEKGIYFMNKPENIKKYEELTNKRILILKDLIKQDNEALINEILN